MRPGQRTRVASWLIGLAVVAAVAIVSFVAFAGTFAGGGGLLAGGGNEFKAVFATSQGVRSSAEVRIAGITVGDVTAIELLAPAEQAAQATAARSAAEAETLAPLALVTMKIDDEGLPLKQDATFKLRPRLFLEGNLFVEVRPGSPAAPEATPGHTFGLTQTSAAVKLDRILTTLQSDVRSRLQTTLAELGGALVRDGGADGLRRFYATAPGAFRDTARVNQALLGTEPRDLSRLSANFGRVSRAFARNREALQGVVVSLNDISAALAADSPALRRTIAELPRTLAAGNPAFDRLNAALPPLRALARELTPGVESSPAWLAAATPLARELRLLAGADEARGLLRDLDPAIADLARLSSRSAGFFEQARALSSCVTDVVVPWSRDSVSAAPAYPFAATDPVYKETAFALVGAGGESRSGDANGQYVRAFSASGANTVVFPPTEERPEQFVGVTGLPLLGATPAIDSSAKTPYRPDVPCETQEPPSLDAGDPGAPPQQSQLEAKAPLELDGPIGEAMRSLAGRFQPLERAARLHRSGERRAARRIAERVLEGIVRQRVKGESRLSRQVRQLRHPAASAGGTGNGE